MKQNRNFLNADSSTKQNVFLRSQCQLSVLLNNNQYKFTQ